MHTNTSRHHLVSFVTGMLTTDPAGHVGVTSLFRNAIGGYHCASFTSDAIPPFTGNDILIAVKTAVVVIVNPVPVGFINYVIP